jgi:hypothetical protein
MSTPRHDDDELLLELPDEGEHSSLRDGGDDGEAVGVEDSEAVTDAELDGEGGSEDVGLDTEALGAASFDDDLDGALDESDVDSATDDTPLDLGEDLDEDGDEERWTDDSEGGSLGFDDEIDDTPLDDDDDGGLEGVDDPLIAALENDGELPDLDGEDDDEDDPMDDELDALVLELDAR